MRKATTRHQAVPQDLGDGLILRRATVEDTEALATFNAHIHRPPDSDEPDEGIAVWTRDLMSGTHPTCGPSDFTVVEDTRSGDIVSSLNLISQTWSYGGVEFGVGRPELVGTQPDYRRRGLVRAQMEVIHRWSAERGELVQAITGIPWYYRQFGYEMALSLEGGRSGYKPQIPKLKNGETEPYGVRQAKNADVPFIARLDRRAANRYLVACVRDERLWQHELSGWSDGNVNRPALRIVETAEGEAVGFLAHSPRLWGSAMAVYCYELKPGVSWLDVTPSVIRYAHTVGEEYAKRDEKADFQAFRFQLGGEHPVYEVMHDRLPHVHKPYAWYVRVPDLPRFLQHVAPVLERRLAASVLVGHTGQLKISFYRAGVCLAFEGGRLVEVAPWRSSEGDAGGAAFPDLTFLQLLFGYRTLDELEYAFADCRVRNDEARALLTILFPKQASHVWPLS